jgi:ABC-2 type transport system permease protein
MTRVLLYVLIGIIVVLYLLLLAISNVNLPDAGPHMKDIPNILGLPLALPFAFYILSSFGGVLAIILLASIMGNEYNWRTIRTAVFSSESRFKLLTAKLISATILILIGMLIALASGFIMSLITTAIGGYKFDFSFMIGSYLWDQFVQFWRTLYVLIPYTLLGFMFAIAGRSAMPGIASGIGIFFLESIITTFMILAGGWIARVPDYLLLANVRSLSSLTSLPQSFSSGMGSAGIKLPGELQAFIVIAVYSILFLAISFYLFHKRDVTG